MPPGRTAPAYNPADYDANGNYIGAGSQPTNYIPGSTYVPPSEYTTNTLTNNPLDPGSAPSPQPAYTGDPVPLGDPYYDANNYVTPDGGALPTIGAGAAPGPPPQYSPDQSFGYTPPPPPPPEEPILWEPQSTEPVTFIPGSSYVPPMARSLDSLHAMNQPPMPGGKTRGQVMMGANPFYVPGTFAYGSSKETMGKVPPVVPPGGAPGGGAAQPPRFRGDFNEERPVNTPTTFIPGSTYRPASAGPAVPSRTWAREGGVEPGPPRTYVPGSTFIPGTGVPTNPRKERGVNPEYVPGSRAFQQTSRTSLTPLSAGLGSGGSPPPPLAYYNPRDYSPIDPHQPQAFQPGSSYFPRLIGFPAVGDPDWQRRARMFTSPSSLYGVAGGDTHLRPSAYSNLIFTSYPATGATETFTVVPFTRPTLPGRVNPADASRVILNSPIPPRPVPWATGLPVGLSGAPIAPRRMSGLLGSMETQRLGLNTLPGLFGGGSDDENDRRGSHR